MLSYCRGKWQANWLPGMNLSLDEMTMGFKGRSALVTRIKYKKEGDGFQCDAICEDGYCFTFWFRCDLPPRPAPKDVSERDNRCAWLVEQLPGKWYHLWMDNLFTSWKLGEMLAVRQCLFGGTCQTADWRGLHSKVIQKQATKADELAKARGTLLASWRPQELKDASGAAIEKTDVLCTSYYEENAEKPFHMMSNIVGGVEVIELRRLCFSTATRRHFYVTFKRLSLADLYNKHMNSVDMSDQLRNVYRPDGLWLRQRKWWWSIFLWCLGQAITNAYLDYKRTCELEKKKPMAHLDFQEAVATAWCRTPFLISMPDGKAKSPKAPATPAAAAEPAAAAAGASGGSSADGSKKRAPKLTKEKLAASIESFALNPLPHQVEECVPKPSGNANECQLCVNGYGPKGEGRHQFDAHLRCACCGIMVCGAFCWKKLHGMK